MTGLALDALEANPNVSGSIAADVKSLNDSLGDATAYTPTISYSDESITALTVANVSFFYQRIGKLLFMSGRFQITDLGGSGNAMLLVSLPQSFTAVNRAYVGPLGVFILDNAAPDVRSLDP